MLFGSQHVQMIFCVPEKKNVTQMSNADRMMIWDDCPFKSLRNELTAL